MDGARLTRLRKAARMTQAELAERLGIPRQSISAYERNISEPPDTVQKGLAEVFQVSLDYLFGLIDEPLPYRRNAASLALPKGFPPEELPAVMRYIDFIMYQNGQGPQDYQLQLALPIEER